jgi:hypothetical protein
MKAAQQPAAFIHQPLFFTRDEPLACLYITPLDDHPERAFLIRKFV